MLETLLGQLKGVLGKSYLLAGLLPAAVLFFGLWWFRRGVDGLRLFVADLRLKPEQVTADVLLSGLLLLGLGLLFFALRGAVLKRLQAGPERRFHSWREGRVRKRQTEWRDQLFELDSLLWDHTVLSWPGTGFEDSTYLPSWLPKDESRSVKVISASEAARETLKEVAEGKHKYPEPDKAKVILDGLKELVAYVRGAYGGHDAGACALEVAAWEELLKSGEAQQILDFMAKEVHRKYARNYESFYSSFPTDQQWVQPTKLGNRLAALDDYAARRYNIDTSTLWTRLWGVLSDPERREVSDAQLALEVFTNLCAAFALLAVAVLLWAGYDTLNVLSAAAAAGCFGDGARPEAAACQLTPFNWRTLAAPGSIVLAFFFYHGANFAFSGLAEKMKRLTDLRRLQLLQAFGYKMPKTVGEELRLFEELSGFFAQANARPDWRLIEPPGKASEGAAAKKPAAE